VRSYLRYFFMQVSHFVIASLSSQSLFGLYFCNPWSCLWNKSSGGICRLTPSS